MMLGSTPRLLRMALLSGAAPPFCVETSNRSVGHGCPIPRGSDFLVTSQKRENTPPAFSRSGCWDSTAEGPGSRPFCCIELLRNMGAEHENMEALGGRRRA